MDFQGEAGATLKDVIPERSEFVLRGDQSFPDGVMERVGKRKQQGYEVCVGR